ncbi:MAG: ATP-binding protein [Bacteroidota bacterium]
MHTSQYIRWIIVLLMWIGGPSLLAQETLQQWEQQAENGTGLEKTKALNQLASAYVDANPDQCISYASLALAEANQLESQYMELGNADLRLPDILRAKADANYYLGRAYEVKSTNRKARRYYKEASRIARTANYDALGREAAAGIERTSGPMNPGGKVTNWTKNALDQLDEWVESGSVDEKVRNKTRGIVSSTLINLAKNAEANGNYPKAIQHYEDLVPYYESSQDTTQIQFVYEKLILLYGETGNVAKQGEYQAMIDAFVGAPPEERTLIAASKPEKPLTESVEELRDIAEEAEALVLESQQEQELQETGEQFLATAEQSARKGDYIESYNKIKQYAAYQQMLHEMETARRQDSMLLVSNLRELEQLRLTQELQTAQMKRNQSQRNWLLLSLSLILFIAGLSTYLFITKRNAHKETAQAFDALDDAHQQLKATQGQLVSAEKMASLGQLTAGIAHEINNPVNFISGNINPLKQDVQDLLTILNAYEQAARQFTSHAAFHQVDQLKEELEINYVTEEIVDLIEGIDEGAGRTAEIVKGLRTFARLDAEEWRSFDLHQGLDSTLALLKPQLGQVEILRDYAKVPEIEGFPGKINQVFMNILTNAIQAMPDGGLLHVITFPYPDEVEIRVRDTGKGIPEEVRNRIFEPFFTTKDVGEGTGLGLAISHGIIEQHHGRIEIESIDGQGTEVIIRLPIRQPVKES